MPLKTSPKIAAASIPNITTLRNELDYGDSRLPRCAAFYDETRAFRRRFKTQNGIDGVDLHDWRSSEVQAGLTAMTVAYLDGEGNGARFWPDDKHSRNYNKYQYSKDAPRIRRLVKQLFFRLNQQQFRNQKYKHKDNPDAKVNGERGHSEQTAIDVDSITFSYEKTPPNNRPDVSEESSIAHLPNYEEHLGEDHHLFHANIYDVPTSNPPSPPRMRQFEAINQLSRTKRNISSADALAQDQQAKRQKRHPNPPTSMHDAREAVQTKTFTDPNRKPSRTRKVVQRAGMVGLDGMNEAIEGNDKNRAISPGREQSPSDNSLRHAMSPTPEETTKLADPPALARPAERPHPEPRQEEPVRSPISPRRPPSPGVPRAPIPDMGQDLFALPRTPDPTVSQSSTQLPSRDRESGQPKQTLQQPTRASSPPPPVSTASTNTAASSSISAAKPSVHFNYWVVLTRTPRTVTERWNPRGRFQDKTLAELRKELHFDDGLDASQGLMFTIESECIRMVNSIEDGDEDGFASMKRYISMEIREWMLRQKRSEPSEGGGAAPKLAIDMRIERMGDSNNHGAEGLEELDVEW